MAYKTRVKCFVKLLLDFYANAERAPSGGKPNVCRPNPPLMRNRRDARALGENPTSAKQSHLGANDLASSIRSISEEQAFSI